MWTEWNRGSVAPPSGAEVVVQYRDGSTDRGAPESFDWSVVGLPEDIVAWCEADRVPASPIETLRDRFAMAALTGLLARRGMSTQMLEAERAYAIADMMMEARRS